jgi:cyclase
MRLQPLFFSLIITVFSTVTSADNQQAASFSSTEITPSLIMLQGKGGNIVLSKGSNGLLIIDDDYAEMSAALTQEINKYGGIEKLKYIINTHWHGDHTGSNTALGHGVNIVAHDNVRQRLNSHQEIPFFNMVSEAQPKHALPSITYPDSMRLHFNNDVISLQHYPNGHTDGDSVVFFEKANVVHMGDHMFHNMYPFIDLSSGGNVVSYANNVQQVLENIDDKTVVIPGHGSLTNKHGLLAFHQMLTGTIDEVRTMKDAGLSLKQVQSKGLSKKWEKWNGGFIKQGYWISFIYASL